MSREFGFYLMVPGMCVYLGLLSLVYYFPVQSAMNGALSADEAIFYAFLFLVFYPVSLVLMVLGNRGLQILSSKWLLPLSGLPFVVAVGILLFA
jgi:hypothetical protein